MSLKDRLDKLDARLPADPNAPPLVLVVVEDAEGRWCHWDDEPAQEIDPATAHPRTQLVIFRLRPEGPQ